MARRATRNAQQKIYRLYFGAFETRYVRKGGGSVGRLVVNETEHWIEW